MHALVSNYLGCGFMERYNADIASAFGSMFDEWCRTLLVASARLYSTIIMHVMCACILRVASSPGSLIFSTHARKEGEPISEGSTILRGRTELRLIDQRCQTGLKLMLCSKASATPFCQHLSRNFRSQARPLLFFPVSEKG